MRLGSSLANIGDLDIDGVDDIVIGAPGAGTGSRHGSLYVALMNE